MNEQQKQNFWAKVDKTETCWLWTATKDDFGYGRVNVTVDGKSFVHRAHRLAYQLMVGEVLPPLILDHICHTPPCVNPAHLRPVTRKQNIENLSGANKLSKSGVRGVFWHKQNKKWRVMVRHNGRNMHIGMFHHIEDAEAAAIAARNRLYTHNENDRRGVTVYLGHTLQADSSNGGGINTSRLVPDSVIRRYDIEGAS